MHDRLALLHDDPLFGTTSADDRHLRGNDHEAGEAPSDHAEVRQRNGRAAQLLRWNRTRRCIGAHAVDAGTQIGAIALADVTHDRNDQTTLKIDRNAHVDALEQAPFSGLRVIPRIERWLRLAGGSDGMEEADGDVGPLRPGFDIDFIPHRRWHHLGLRSRPALRLYPAHPFERFRRSGVGEAAGGPLNISASNHAARPAALYQVEIDVELPRERANGGEHLHPRPGRPRFRAARRA